MCAMLTATDSQKTVSVKAKKRSKRQRHAMKVKQKSTKTAQNPSSIKNPSKSGVKRQNGNGKQTGEQLSVGRKGEKVSQDPTTNKQNLKSEVTKNGLPANNSNQVLTDPKSAKRKRKISEGNENLSVKKLRKTQSTEANSRYGKEIAKRRKEKKGKSKKPKAASKKAAESQKAAPVEPEVEPDKNWKLLSKQLGIDPYQRKSMEKATEDKTTQESSSDESGAEEPEIWFDGVDEMLIEGKVSTEEPVTETQSAEVSKNKGSSVAELEKKLVIKSGSKGLTKYLAMDCEMVGVGPDGDDSVLARISVVNQFGHCVYDKFVKPQEEVTDYRTWVSGVRPEDLENAEEISVVQKEVDKMFKGRVLVGHAITNDEKVLFMNHPKRYVRDTQKYPGYRQLVKGRRPGLKMLAKRILGINIQSGEHSSVQDAQATMRLFMLIREKWEKWMKEKGFIKKYKKDKQVELVKKNHNKKKQNT